MSAHDAWHIFVLTTTLLAAASLVIGLLAPLVFDPLPDSYRRYKPIAAGLAGLGLVVLIVEWLGVH